MRCAHGSPARLPWGIFGVGVEMEGAMQQAPQPGRQSIAIVLIAAGACWLSARACFGLKCSRGWCLQAFSRPQHLIHHGAHAVAVGLLHQGA